MRTREKVVVALLAATLILGVLIYLAFRDNELEANYFRWLFANNLKYGFSSPLKYLSEELPAGTLFYGGLTIFAVVMFVVFLKMTRDGEIQALRTRLLALISEKRETENVLQEVVWKGKHEQQAKDSVTRDLEGSIEKIEVLLGELSEKERQLKARDVELVTLKSNALADTDPALARTPADRLLREELKKKTETLQAKDAAIKELEQRSNAKARLWESQLREKDGLLRDRDGELEGLRVEISDLNERLHDSESAKKRAGELLHEELRKTKEVLEANDLSMRSEQKRLADKIRTLESQLSEKDKFLRTRDTELNGFRRQLGELESTKEQMEGRLHEELEKSEQDRLAKDHLIKDLEQRLSANIHALRTEAGEKDLLLQVRDGEIQSLKSEARAISLRLSEMAAAKVRAEEGLQEELKKEKQQREEERVAYRDFEERHAKETSLLTAQLGEREEFIKRRDAEMQSLKEELYTVSQRLGEVGAAKEESERSLREELKKEKAQQKSREIDGREREQRHGIEVQTLKSQLGEKDEFLKSHNEEIKSLKTQVASLAEQLSKVGSAKERAASLLQQKLRAEKEGLQASDSAARELEQSFKAKIDTLEEQLAKKQELVGSRDKDVAALKSELTSLHERMNDLAASKERAERLFEEAVKEKTELTASNDASAKKLAEDMGGRIRELESRIRKQEELLHNRESELSAFQHQFTDLASSKEHAARALHEDLRRKTELLDEKEAAIHALEERSSMRINTLESDLVEKQDRLQARDHEVKELMAKVNALSDNLAEIRTSKDSAVRMLRGDLKLKTESLDAKAAAIIALEERLNGKVRSLENELHQKQELLSARDTDLDALMAKVSELSQKLSEMGAERERSDRLRQEELREKTLLLQSRETSIGELEEHLKDRVESLERQVVEKHKLLESSGVALSELRAQFNAMTERLNDAEAAKITLEGLLQQERSKTDKALTIIPISEKDSDEGLNGGARGLETLLNEREQLLQARDKLIDNLMVELKEKKTQLARQEIEVWQKIERREAWKHRLSKIGIRMKD